MKAAFVPSLFPASTSTSLARTDRVRLRSSTAVRMSSNAIDYGRIQHAGILVKDTKRSKQFYMDVFGMVDDDELRNPKLPFKGAFLRVGQSQIHLMELPIIDPLEGRPEHGGRDRHFAVTVRDLDPLRASLEKHGRPYTVSRSGRRALFTRDLDENALEFIEDKGN